MLSLWANWLVTKFGLNSLKRYLWPVLYQKSHKWLIRHNTKGDPFRTSLNDALDLVSLFWMNGLF